MDVGKVDPIMNQLEGMADFNLLKYVNDDFNDTLLDRLGLSVPLGINSPVPVRSENNHKLQDANASDYITLESSPPQIQQYYTIDTEEIHSYHGNTEVPSPEVADNAISVVAEENPAQFNDRPTHIVLDSSDNVMNLGEGALPLFLHANPSEQHIFMTQDTTDGIFIITGTGNGDSTIPQAIQISQSPSSASLMESLIVGENDLSPTDVAIATPSPASPSPPPAKTSSAKPRASRRQRPKKPKKYEITESLKNPVEEKKRLNAINAKKNREMKKDKLRELGDKVEAVTKERDQLLKEVEELKRREKQLRELLLLRQQNNLRNNVL